MKQPLDELRQKIHGETARMSWQELERFYAEGKLVTISPELDLIDVAANVAENKAEQVQKWLDSGQMQNTTDEQAIRWQQENAELWTVLVLPWILVQQREQG